jgi:ABC-type glycerol-3-phosphate transport system substrate-binding protein
LQAVGIQIWHPWLGVEASLLEAQVAKFNKVNEWGIAVRAMGHSSFTELYTDISESLAGAEGPQLAVTLPEHPIEWDASGYVVDLDSYIADPAYGLESGEVSDFPTVFWNQDVVAGTRLGVPAQRSARLVIYNKAWARELGFEDPPLTEAQFREQACAAHTALLRDEDPANDGQGGWIVDTHSMTLLSWMVSFGGGVLDGSGYRFLSPKNLEAVAFLKQLYDDACAWLPRASEEPAAAFAARGALFATGGLEELSEFGRALAAAENSDEWTVLTVPGPDQPGIVTYGSSFVVFTGSPEQQLASWLFIRWILSPENQKEWVEATGLFPLRSSMVEQLASYSRSHPQWAAAVQLVPRAQIQPQLASWRMVRVMLGDGFNAMFRSDTPSGRVAEILAIMDRTASDLAK